MIPLKKQWAALNALDLWATEVLEKNVLDHLLGPLLDMTTDLFIEERFDKPVTAMLEVVNEIDLEQIGSIWEAAQSGAEPERDTLEGRLVHRAAEVVGSLSEMAKIPWPASWAMALVYRAFESLVEEGQLNEWMPEEAPVPAGLEEPPNLIHWRMSRGNGRALECEIDGTLVGVDFRDPDDADETNAHFWLVIEHHPNHGFTVLLDREVWLDPEESTRERRTIQRMDVRETNYAGTENKKDAPITPVVAVNGQEPDYYAILVRLWALGLDLATNTVELVMGMRSGAYVTYRWMRDPIEHPNRYKKEGPGPFSYNSDTWQGSEYPEKFAGRNPRAITGRWEIGDLVRFEEGGS